LTSGIGGRSLSGCDPESMIMNADDARLETRGEEFRDDLRPLASRDEAPVAAAAPRAGSGNAAARRILSGEEVASLTRLNDLRSALGLLQTLAVIAAAMAFGIHVGPSPWILASILVIGVQQHGLFILAHESAHYRLFAHRGLNDAVGRLIGMAGGISMCTYRVIHRLHHNNLYTEKDPDTAIHGGYPRGVRYLWQKLAQDLVGWNAWKTFAYFFGAPAVNGATNRAARPLDDTSEHLRAVARVDRRMVVAFQLAAPLVCWLAAGRTGLVMYLLLWAVPLVTVLQPILRLRAICEHGAVTDLSSPLTAARTNVTTVDGSRDALDACFNLAGRALLFPHHVNYHLEHHLYPAVPHYHLPRLHRMLRAKGALEGAQVCSLRETLGAIFAPRRPRASAAAQGT
jgi:fatty acid desaturase